MSKKSEAVKRWRQNSKERIIESMGGKCAICGYNKRGGAFDIHHIDPNEKEISFGSIRANPQSWNKIVEELRKCVLLCANCHREVHSGITELPESLPNFNEKFAEYRERNIIEKDKCPVCGRLKNSMYKTCSLSCSGKMHQKIDWNSIDLYELYFVHKKNYTQIGEMFNVTGTSVKKRMKKIGII